MYISVMFQAMLPVCIYSVMFKVTLNVCLCYLYVYICDVSSYITCVYISVMFQVTFLFETFSTDVTFVRFLRRVNFPMTSETVVMAKLFPADVTIISSVFTIAVITRVGTEA